MAATDSLIADLTDEVFCNSRKQTMIAAIIKELCGKREKKRTEVISRRN